MQKSVSEKLDKFITQKNGAPKLKILERLAVLMLDEIGRIDNEKDLRLGKDFCLYQYLADCERNIIRYALYIADNNQSVASRLLGIKPTTLNVKIKRYKICGTAPENPSKRALAGQKRRSRRQG